MIDPMTTKYRWSILFLLWLLFCLCCPSLDTLTTVLILAQRDIPILIPVLAGVCKLPLPRFLCDSVPPSHSWELSIFPSYYPVPTHQSPEPRCPPSYLTTEASGCSWPLTLPLMSQPVRIWGRLSEDLELKCLSVFISYHDPC